MLQIFVNLVQNSIQSLAIREPGEELSISISSEEKDGMVILRFQDTGAGIPPEYQDKIFEPFFTT